VVAVIRRAHLCSSTANTTTARGDENIIIRFAGEASACCRTEALPG